jgi:hypothetical protein
MNRHQRRKSERVRSQLAGYRHRIADALDSSPTMAGELRRRTVRAIIEHDGWCAIYTARRVCACTPNISMIPFDHQRCRHDRRLMSPILMSILNSIRFSRRDH